MFCADRLGNVQIMITKEEHDDVTKPKVISGVLSALKVNIINFFSF